MKRRGKIYIIINIRGYTLATHSDNDFVSDLRKKLMEKRQKKRIENLKAKRQQQGQ